MITIVTKTQEHLPGASLASSPVEFTSLSLINVEGTKWRDHDRTTLQPQDTSVGQGSLHPPKYAYGWGVFGHLVYLCLDSNDDKKKVRQGETGTNASVKRMRIKERMGTRKTQDKATFSRRRRRELQRTQIFVHLGL